MESKPPGCRRAGCFEPAARAAAQPARVPQRAGALKWLNARETLAVSCPRCAVRYACSCWSSLSHSSSMNWPEFRTTRFRHMPGASCDGGRARWVRPDSSVVSGTQGFASAHLRGNSWTVSQPEESCEHRLGIFQRHVGADLAV